MPYLISLGLSGMTEGTFTKFREVLRNPQCLKASAVGLIELSSLRVMRVYFQFVCQQVSQIDRDGAIQDGFGILKKCVGKACRMMMMGNSLNHQVVYAPQAQ